MPPFFSIIVPTRNRSQLLERLLRSVLSQDFGDFELIVSDNSSPEESVRTRQFFDEVADGRSRYVRPPCELGMAAHWEWALQHACGEYVGFLTDRACYKPGALKLLQQTLRRHDLDCVSFRSDFVAGGEPPYTLVQRPHSGRVYRAIPLSASQLVARSHVAMAYLTPRMMESMTRRGCVRRIIERYGDAFGSICPDYAFAMRAFDLLESLGYLDRALTVFSGTQLGTGRAFFAGTKNAAAVDFERHVRQQKILELSVLPDVMLPCNFIFFEYERLRALPQARRFTTPLDPGDCYRTALWEFDLQQPGPTREQIGRALEAFRRRHDVPSALFTRLRNASMRWAKHDWLVKYVLPHYRRAAELTGIDPLSIHRRDVRVPGFASLDAAIAHANDHPRRPTTQPLPQVAGLRLEELR